MEQTPHNDIEYVPIKPLAEERQEVIARLEQIKDGIEELKTLRVGE